VREDAGNVTIGASVLSGTPMGDVTVSLLTLVGGTATGRVPKVCRGRKRRKERLFVYSVIAEYYGT